MNIVLRSPISLVDHEISLSNDRDGNITCYIDWYWVRDYVTDDIFSNWYLILVVDQYFWS